MKTQFNPVIKTKFVNYLTWKRVEIKRFQARKFIFLIQTIQSRNKVLQIIFGNDGSLYVSFPYFDNNQGIISIGSLSEISPKININLEAMGKITTNKVKYSHHLSGDVRFSQTGIVKSEIKKKSIPLVETEGHIFTLFLQGLNHFEQDTKLANNPPSLNRTELCFLFEDDIPGAVKIVGRWYDIKTWINRSRGSSIGPIEVGETPNGKRTQMFLVSPPSTSDIKNHLLTINCEPVPLLNKEQDSLMLFIGGFGTPKDTLLYQKESFLCAMYPVADFKDVESRIGSIDLSFSS